MQYIIGSSRYHAGEQAEAGSFDHGVSAISHRRSSGEVLTGVRPPTRSKQTFVSEFHLTPSSRSVDDFVADLGCWPHVHEPRRDHCRLFALRDLFRARPSSAALTAFVALATSDRSTGFLLPLKGVSPAVAISILALILLAAVLLAPGRSVARDGLGGSMSGLGGERVPADRRRGRSGLHEGPAGQGAGADAIEPPFALVQGTVLVAFVLIGIQALRVSRRRGTRPSFR